MGGRHLIPSYMLSPITPCTPSNRKCALEGRRPGQRLIVMAASQESNHGNQNFRRLPVSCTMPRLQNGFSQEKI